MARNGKAKKVTGADVAFLREVQQGNVIYWAGSEFFDYKGSGQLVDRDIANFAERNRLIAIQRNTTGRNYPVKLTPAGALALVKGAGAYGKPFNSIQRELMEALKCAVLQKSPYGFQVNRDGIITPYSFRDVEPLFPLMQDVTAGKGNRYFRLNELGSYAYAAGKMPF